MEATRQGGGEYTFGTPRPGSADTRVGAGSGAGGSGRRGGGFPTEERALLARTVSSNGMGGESYGASLASTSGSTLGPAIGGNGLGSGGGGGLKRARDRRADRRRKKVRGIKVENTHRLAGDFYFTDDV